MRERSLNIQNGEEIGERPSVSLSKVTVNFFLRELHNS